MRYVPLRTRHSVLRDIEANFIPLVAGIFTVCKRLVDLIADLLAHRRALLKPLVVPAGVQRGGHYEDWL
ncbi:MAG: hypothetical protein ABSD67_23400 [Terracidiphilus sp.]